MRGSPRGCQRSCKREWEKSETDRPRCKANWRVYCVNLDTLNRLLLKGRPTVPGSATKIQSFMLAWSIWSHYHCNQGRSRVESSCCNWVHGIACWLCDGQFISASRICRGLPYCRLLPSYTRRAWRVIVDSSDWLSSRSTKHHCCCVHEARHMHTVCCYNIQRAAEPFSSEKCGALSGLHAN